MAGLFHSLPITPGVQGCAQRLGIHLTLSANAFLHPFWAEADDPSISRMAIQGATSSCYLALSF